MKHRSGFTLIEMSIVLVIIGLIIGSILVGQDLISAAAVRAQISQIDKYNAAVNTFRTKYNGQIPGDIKEPYATRFGFTPRGHYTGQGDGNGILQGNYNNSSGGGYHYTVSTGEPAMFWVDLSVAGLLDGTFSAATPTGTPVSMTGTQVDTIFPKAKISPAGHVYVGSDGWQGMGNTTTGDGENYFTVTNVTGINGQYGTTNNSALMTPLQAYAIDSKMDDGLPQFGNVQTFIVNNWSWWASGSNYPGDFDGTNNGPVTTQTTIVSRFTTLAQSCYNNGNKTNVIETYSLTVNGGTSLTCSLSFKFQ